MGTHLSPRTSAPGCEDVKQPFTKPQLLVLHKDITCLLPVPSSCNIGKIQGTQHHPLIQKVSEEVWFTPIILATQEAESGRIPIQGQPEQKVIENPFQRIRQGSGAYL
jgi:hypothetical protein